MAQTTRCLLYRGPSKPPFVQRVGVASCVEWFSFFLDVQGWLYWCLTTGASSFAWQCADAFVYAWTAQTLYNIFVQKTDWSNGQVLMMLLFF